MSRQTPLDTDYEYVLRIIRGQGYTITKEELFSKSRNPPFVLIRAVVAYYLRSKDHVLTSIGDLINRDHSTVIHMLKYPETNPRGAAEYNRLIAIIKNVQ